MEHFTPISASIGGVLIGLSATMLWLANGRIAGISGIVGGLWTARTGDVAWRIAFAIGLVAAPVLYGMAGGKLPQITVSVPWPFIMIAGLLVGFGTRLGGGCTSGHGVCGLARLSQRSLVATGSFMATAIVTSFILRHAVGAAPPADENTVIAQNLAEMLREGVTVISDNQKLIDDPELGDKHLTGEVVLAQAVKSFSTTMGFDPTKIDPASRHGRLLREMMDAIAEVVDANQSTINAKGVGFKGLIPAVFARHVDEVFNRRAQGEAKVKFTAPPELIRNRKARPDAWEAEIIKTKLLAPNWPRGQPYSAVIETDGRPAYRVMVPRYYDASCLACHGSPKGEMDVTGYPKEGKELGDLGGVVSIILYH